MDDRSRTNLCRNLSVTAAMLATLGLGGCPDADRPAYVSTPGYSSAIEYHASTGRLLIGDYHDGAVRTVDPRRSDQRLLLAPHSDGRRRALRIKVDAARDRLWILDNGDVHVYAMTTARLIRRIELPAWIFGPAHYSCLPDMALDQAGAAFISSNAQTMLWRIDPLSLEVTQLEIDVDADRHKEIGFTGLAFSADGRTLFAVSAAQGSLWRLDAGTRQAAKIHLSAPIWGACAVTALPADHASVRDGRVVLLVPGGFRSGVYRVDVSADLERAEVTKVLAASAAAVSTGVALTTDVAYLLDSRLSEHPDFFGDAWPEVGSALIAPIRLGR